MSTTAVKSPAHAHSHSHSQSHSQSRSRPSTTPRGYPHSVGQSKAPLLSPKGRSPQASQNPQSPSPSYFGFVVGGEDSIPPDSNPGHHARQNWSFVQSSAQTTVSTPRHLPNESNPEFEAFRRQSEQKGFNLNQSFSSLSPHSQSRTHSVQSTPQWQHAESPISPLSKKPMLERSMKSFDTTTAKSPYRESRLFFEGPRQQSPGPITPKHSVEDHQRARLSLPINELTLPTFNTKKAQRSDTLPPTSDHGVPAMVSPAMIAELLQSPVDMLLLDLRVYQQYATARIHGSLNLCIPTTLLKRPSFTTQKLCDTFTSDENKAHFERWREYKYIVVYDANSTQPKDANTCINVLKKFASEGWDGTGLVIKGGFLAFSRLAPDLIDRGPAAQKGSSTHPLSIVPPMQDAVPVAGGCTMPSAKTAANPFFGNIRQNMDLLDGVGQIPIEKPSKMSDKAESNLPSWLQEASRPSDEGKTVSEKFLSIERSEQRRMQDALTAKVSYGTPTETHRPIQIAGIEKGSKNRYNNIFPYDHTRVRLQSVPTGGCDYVNANHVRAQFSNRHYIATQAPIPATFNDFWRVVWEQDVRVIVMLTAEAEGGQIKSHTYWNPGEYGAFKVKKLSERKVSLEPKDSSAKSSSSEKRPSLGQRRSTTDNVQGERKSAENVSPASEPPVVAIRTFTLSHSNYPFQPMREITQLQYAQWPDFGAPASPNAILGLIEQMNRYVRGSSSPSSTVGPEEAAPRGQRPIIVHCSAGCGRTGTFCTIDSVIDMLKRQRSESGEDMMDTDANDWVKRDDQDLVAKTVEDFRNQRLSMVQNLRQFVLCYESILQWVVQQQQADEDRLRKAGKDGIRRSYQG